MQELDSVDYEVVKETFMVIFNHYIPNSKQA